MGNNIKVTNEQALFDMLNDEAELIPLLSPEDEKKLPFNFENNVLIGASIVSPYKSTGVWILAGSIIGTLLVILIVSFLLNRIGKKRKKK